MARTKKLSTTDWDAIQATAADIVSRWESEQEAFTVAVAQRLPWFDGSSTAWARLRATLTTKLGENLDYWLDRCDERMLLGFVEAIAEEAGPVEYSEPMTRQQAAKMLDVSTRTITRLRKEAPEMFKDSPGRRIRVRLDAIRGHSRTTEDT